MFFVNRILLIALGFFLLYINFFPIHYFKPKERVYHHLSEVIQDFSLESLPVFRIHQDSDYCLMVFSFSSEFPDFPCVIYFRSEIWSKDFKKNLDFLYWISDFLVKQKKRVILYTENDFHHYGFFVAGFFPEVEVLIINGSFYQELPWIWKVFEPRICQVINPDRCIKYKLYKFVFREEFLKQIRSPVFWYLSKEELLHSNENIKKSLDVFHQLGETPSFKTKKRIFMSNSSKKEEIFDLIQNQLAIYIVH
ncbi:MAG: hypothetical protein NZ853_04290 [Leptospiraceae bacterium]|nr:hypothetical protein [Leptospiraceae bacterium]MDW7975393.1 hypothetical protein [Leptospiraceae bacterium]